MTDRLQMLRRLSARPVPDPPDPPGPPMRFVRAGLQYYRVQDDSGEWLYHYQPEGESFDVDGILYRRNYAYCEHAMIGLRSDSATCEPMSVDFGDPLSDEDIDAWVHDRHSSREGID